MQLRRAGLTLGLSFLVGCGGTFTQQGEPTGTGGTAGAGSSAGAGARGGTTSGGKGNGGDVSYGAYGGDLGGYGNGGGNISYGGYGASAGDISYAGEAGVGGGCGPAVSASGPYPVEFEFTSNTPVYIKQDCTLRYDISSCSSGTHPILRDASCVADCSDTSIGCVACGACASGARMVGPGASLEDGWDGRIYTYGTLPSGCSCASGANAAPGVYTLVIAAYLSEADAIAGSHPFMHQVQFELPQTMSFVSVDLGFQGI